MRCANCGKELVPSAKFCEECGTSVTSVVPSTLASSATGLVSRPADATAPVPAAPAAPVGTATLAPSAVSAAQASAPAQNWDGGQSFGSGGGHQFVNQNTITTNVHVGGPNIIIARRDNGPNLFVRFIWFLFIGWWLGPITLLAAYVLFLLVVTIPLSMGLFNRIPQVMTLRPRNTNFGVTSANGATMVEETTHEQHPWYVRLPYFVFIGSWVTLLWFSAAWILSWLALPMLGLSLVLAFWMFNRIGAVATLYRT